MWLAPTMFGGIVVILMSLIYIGSLVNPTARLHDLPVVLVDQDHGAATADGRVDYGELIASRMTASPEVRSALHVRAASLPEAKRSMDEGSTYLAIIIPPDFTKSLLQRGKLRRGEPHPASSDMPAMPTITLLTNPRLGSAGVGLASGVTEEALSATAIRLNLQPHPDGPTGRTSHAVTTAQLSGPITFTTSEYRPLPDDSALGLSAFYLALLATMCGFLGATLVNSAVDSGLGFAATELGPRWRQRPPTPISRWQTLLTKWAMVTVLVPGLTSLVLLVSVLVLGLDAPGTGYLWMLMTLDALTIAIGTLGLLAALGSLGQLVALIMFVYLALAASGATIPIQAIPQPFQLISHVDPLHQTVDALRAVLYFDGNPRAGWPTAVLVLAAELILWLGIGATTTRSYDRRGLSRLPPPAAG